MSNLIASITYKMWDEQASFMDAIFKVCFYIFLIITYAICVYSYFVVLPQDIMNSSLTTTFCKWLGTLLQVKWWNWIVIPFGSSIILSIAIAQLALDMTLKFARHLFHSYVGD
jgi:hypothetical protein